MSDHHGPAPFPLRGTWASGSTPDPVTGLLGFPEFYACLPSFLEDRARHGQRVGIAIGDVDHLKSFVENTNATEPGSFGHLAGNALMSTLGRICSSWFHSTTFPVGCVSTFGGDEVIVAAVVNATTEFETSIAALRDQCCQQLPRPVSFARTTRAPRLGTDWRSYAAETLSTVDKALFRRKAARCGTIGDLGFVVGLDEVVIQDVHPAA